ncbi:MAG: hypothetical protein MJB57_14825 [Gemmatimonadetes bacterium]|nr:hypothetical protein [Gemmatimonadota bacterium]
MRMGRFATIGAAAACVAFFAACESTEDPIAPPPAQNLTSAEAEALNEKITAMAFQGWGFDQATASTVPAAGPGVSMNAVGAPITIDWALGVRTACDEGGTFDIDGTITGTIDDQTLAGDLTLGVTTSMVDCGFMAETQVFTFDTSPDLQLDGTVAWDRNGLVGVSTFTYAGGLDWAAADGRSGSCTFDVTVTLRQDGTETAAGTVCGESVDSGAGS